MEGNRITIFSTNEPRRRYWQASGRRCLHGLPAPPQLQPSPQQPEPCATRTRIFIRGEQLGVRVAQREQPGADGARRAENLGTATRWRSCYGGALTRIPLFGAVRGLSPKALCGARAPSKGVSVRELRLRFFGRGVGGRRSCNGPARNFGRAARGTMIGPAGNTGLDAAGASEATLDAKLPAPAGALNKAAFRPQRKRAAFGHRSLSAQPLTPSPTVSSAPRRPSHLIQLERAPCTSPSPCKSSTASRPHPRPYLSNAKHGWPLRRRLHELRLEPHPGRHVQGPTDQHSTNRFDQRNRLLANPGFSCRLILGRLCLCLADRQQWPEQSCNIFQVRRACAVLHLDHGTRTLFKPFGVRRRCLRFR